MDISQIRPETCSFILDQLPGLLYCVEDCRNGQFVKISENCKELFGYTQQEIKSEKEVGLKCLVHKDDYILMKKKLNTKRVSGKNKVFEFRIQTKDGKVKWLRDIETEIVNPNEGPNLIYGILHDITHFKNSGELNRAFAAFQNAVNGGSIVSITDKSGKIIFANELFCKVSKYTQRELIGRKHSILKSGIHDFAFFSDMWETISEGKTWRGEIKNKAKDGSFYWVDTVISPIFDAYGAVEKYLSIRNVITERKIQEQELLEAHQFSQEILNSVAISIAVINKEGKIVSVNKHWDQFAKENSINGKVKTFLGENYFEVCKRSFDAGDDIAGMILTGLQSLAQGLISEYKFDYPCHSENKNRWFTLSANRFGSGEYLVISHHDITSNKGNQRSINKKRRAS